MKARLGILAMVMVVGILCVVAVATDFVWDANTADTNWLTINNWDLDSSYPQSYNDNADLTGGGNRVTLNDNSTLFVNQIVLGGASPTKRKLHVQSTLAVADMVLQDYAYVDVDENVSVAFSTELSGDVWIDVAAGKAFTAYSVEGTRGVHVESAGTVLHLTTGASAGTIIAHGILIDADTPNASRSLKLEGGPLDVYGTAAGVVELISDQGTTGSAKAKLWLASDSAIEMGEGAYFEITGGSSNERRAILDFDVDVSIYPFEHYLGMMTLDGYVSIDLAADKEICMDNLTVNYRYNGTVATLTAGSGAVMNVNVGTCP